MEVAGYGNTGQQVRAEGAARRVKNESDESRLEDSVIMEGTSDPRRTYESYHTVSVNNCWQHLVVQTSVLNKSSRAEPTPHPNCREEGGGLTRSPDRGPILDFHIS